MLAKIFLWMNVSVGILDFLYVKWTKKIFGWIHWVWWLVLCHFNFFRLHAKLYDAARALRAHNGKRRCYCYMIGPNSSFFGHVTRLFFCLYVKLFLISIFSSVNLWSCISCIVLDIRLTNIFFTKELGVFIDQINHGFSLRPPIKYKPPKQAAWCTRKLQGIV